MSLPRKGIAPIAKVARFTLDAFIDATPRQLPNQKKSQVKESKTSWNNKFNRKYHWNGVMVFNEVPDLKILLQTIAGRFVACCAAPPLKTCWKLLTENRWTPLPEIARRTNWFVTNVRAIDRVLPRHLSWNTQKLPDLTKKLPKHLFGRLSGQPHGSESVGRGDAGTTWPELNFPKETDGQNAAFNLPLPSVTKEMKVPSRTQDTKHMPGGE